MRFRIPFRPRRAETSGAQRAPSSSTSGLRVTRPWPSLRAAIVFCAQIDSGPSVTLSPFGFRESVALRGRCARSPFSGDGILYSIYSAARKLRVRACVRGNRLSSSFETGRSGGPRSGNDGGMADGLREELNGCRWHRMLNHAGEWCASASSPLS